MGKTHGPVAWSVAAGLTLLLFGVMSLIVLRTAGTPASAGSTTETPAMTPDFSAAGAEDATPTAVATPGTGEQPSPTAMLGLWLSAVSAITALIGLVSSLWLGWRKEQREVAHHRLQLQRTQLEVEKLRRELGRDVAGESVDGVTPGA
jgi:hypothetical protein